MHSIFDQASRKELLARLEKLEKDAQPLWGEMQAAQMLKHLSQTIKVATGKTRLRVPPWHKRIVFRLFKSSLYNDRPWRKSLPTAAPLRVRSEANFDKEKEKLYRNLEEFLQLKFEGGVKTHPIFGTFTKEQWGKMQFKHFDHHLRQFGL